MFEEPKDPIEPIHKKAPYSKPASNKPILMEKNVILGTTVMLAWGWAVIGVGVYIASTLI